MTPPIRILHLSDFHFSSMRVWDADPLLRGLVRTVDTDVRNGMAPDLVAITGDLVFSGQAEEYRIASRWLNEQLWPVVGEELSRDRLLVVPGNHDVDRSRARRVTRAIQEALLREGSQESIAEVLASEEECLPLFRPLEKYFKFVSEWWSETQTVPWWQRNFNIRGYRLHIAGLASPWMSQGDNDLGRLLLSRYQLNRVFVTPEAEQADSCIALIHHPWSYLAEFDATEAKNTIQLRCQLVLRGHLHNSMRQRVFPPDHSRACMELAGGCLYDGSQYTNSFQWIELWPRSQKLKVYFRVWHQGTWTTDKNIPGSPDGIVEFDLSSGSSAPAPKSSWAPSPDFNKYLLDLWWNVGRLEIRGLVVDTPHSHSLPIEDLYVPLRAKRFGNLGDSSDEENSTEPLEGFLQAKRLIIIGDPGSGKTTFLRWVARTLSGDRLGKYPGAAQSRLGLAVTPLPLLVSISDWLTYIDRVASEHDGPVRPDSPDWLPHYLGAYASDYNCRLDADVFRRALETGNCIVLLDGLDEAPDRRGRELAVALIKGLSRLYDKCAMVVTSRPVAYRDTIVLDEFESVSINPLDDSEIQTFLEHWSKSLFKDRPEWGEHYRYNLYNALASRPDLHRLSRNVLMLLAIAVVHWNEKRLPEQRSELYETVLSWFSRSREQRPGRERPERFLAIMSELALSMQRTRGGRKLQVGLRWAAERIAREFGDANSAIAVERAEAFLETEALDSGVVVQRGNELRFSHLTFQEYLVAKAISARVEREHRKILLGEDRALYQPEWREPVLLLGCVLHQQGRARIDTLITAILDELFASGEPAKESRARCASLLSSIVHELRVLGYEPKDPRYREVVESSAWASGLPLESFITSCDALRQAKLSRLDETVAELPKAIHRFLNATFSIDKVAGEIARLQRRLDTLDRPFIREPLTALLCKEIEGLEVKLTGLNEPLRVELTAVLLKWREHAENQRAAVLQILHREPVRQVFRAGDPVDRNREAFIPRERVLGKLERQLMLASGCPGLILYGRRRMGKSTMLRNLGAFLPQAVKVVYVSMMDARAFSSSATFLELLEEEIDKTTGQIAKYHRSANMDPLAFHTFLKECDARLCNEQKRLLLAVDEYEFIDQKIGEGVFRKDLLTLIRESIQSHRCITWIFAGSHHVTEMRNADWTSYLVSVRTLEVRPFSLPETRLLLTEPLKYSPLWRVDDRHRPRFHPGFWGKGGIERIHSESGGWPHLVQLLAENVVDLFNDSPNLSVVDDSLLECAISESLIGGDVVLRQLMQPEEASEAEWDYLVGFRSRDSQPAPGDEAVFQSLRRRQLIKTDNGQWRLRVPLMLRWLRDRG